VVRRALALVAAGQLRRAASSLLQKGIHDPTPEVEEQLRQLHLSPPVDALPRCPREAPSPSFSPASVHAFLRERAPRGSAPGLSGWTESLLLPLADDPQLLIALTSFLGSSHVVSFLRARKTMGSDPLRSRKFFFGLPPLFPSGSSRLALSRAS